MPESLQRLGSEWCQWGVNTSFLRAWKDAGAGAGASTTTMGQSEARAAPTGAEDLLRIQETWLLRLGIGVSLLS